MDAFEQHESHQKEPRRRGKRGTSPPETAGRIIHAKGEKLAHLSEEQLAELQEQDLEEKFRKPLRKLLDERFPKISRKEKDAYMARVETELLDAFDKVGKDAWHRIEEVRPLWPLGIEQGLAINATYRKEKKTGLHYIQLSGFSLGISKKSEASLERMERIGEVKETKESLQEFVDRKIAAVSFPEMYAALRIMNDVTPNFPTVIFQDIIDEMRRGVDELKRVQGDTVRMYEIAQHVNSRVKDLGKDFDKIGETFWKLELPESAARFEETHPGTDVKGALGRLLGSIDEIGPMFNSIKARGEFSEDAANWSAI